MFVSGLALFGTLLRMIKLVRAEYLSNRKAGQLAKYLRKTVKLYAKGGFLVQLALMNKDFDRIEDLVSLLNANTAAAREHGGKIEREIRLIKERTRCFTTAFPCHWFSKRKVLIHTVYDVCMWLNECLSTTELIGGLSSRDLVTGRKLSCDKYCHADFGA